MTFPVCQLSAHLGNGDGYGDKLEGLQQIASEYDTWAAHHHREVYEQDHGCGLSAMNLVLYSFKVLVSCALLLN